ncbi:hypothetical protein BHC53_07495 [Snodgrassella alvi]|nr:hypothetical protein BHC53_07495 [Snodgrassella alvi]
MHSGIKIIYMASVVRMVLFIISRLLMHQKTVPQKRKLNLLQASTIAFGKSKQHQLPPLQERYKHSDIHRLRFKS